MDLTYKYPTIIFTDEEIQTAQNIWSAEDSIAGRHFIKNKDMWVGILGEWAFEQFYPPPKFKRLARHFNRDSCDFQNTEDENLIEVKNGRWHFFNDRLNLCINEIQYKTNFNNIFLATFHVLGSNSVSLIGWLYHSEIEELGTLMKNELNPRGSYWKVPYSKLRSTSTFYPLTNK